MEDTQKNLRELISLAAKIGADAALYTVSEKQKIEAKQRKDKKLHNTRMLLNKYRIFNEHIDNATYKKEQITEASAVDWLNEMYDPNNRADAVVLSILNNALKTRIMVEHINKMVGIYEIYCNSVDEKNKVKMQRRYDAFYGRYIAPKRVKYEYVSEIWGVDIRTIQNDINEAINDFSSLLFGIDWINV